MAQNGKPIFFQPASWQAFRIYGKKDAWLLRAGLNDKMPGWSAQNTRVRLGHRINYMWQGVQATYSPIYSRVCSCSFDKEVMYIQKEKRKQALNSFI